MALFLFFGSCASQKKIDKHLPEWVKFTPSDPNYYQGIGYAEKVKKSTAHYDLAAKEALRALASEISVEITSSTMLVTLENDKSLTDDFTSIVEARVKADIEGYEKVDSYEDKKGYWVYYRLSKQQYARREYEKRQLAVTQATGYFKLAEKAWADFDFKTAIVQYAKSLDAVKAYLNEPIEVEMDGRTINLVLETHNHMTEIFSCIDIRVGEDALSCKMGSEINSHKLNCSVYLKNRPVGQFPMRIIYSEGAKNYCKATDSNGFVDAGLKVTSRRNTETVTYELDKERLLLESTTDYAIRKWLMQIPSPRKTVVLSIVKPTVSIVSSEKIAGAVMPECQLCRVFEQLFESEKYSLSPLSADYELSISADAKKQGVANGMYTSFLNAKLVLKKRTGELVYSKSIGPFKGVQLSEVKAGETAYQEAARQIKLRIFSEMEGAILKQLK